MTDLQITSTSAHSARLHLSLRLLVFAMVFVVLQLSWQSLRGSAMEYWFVHDATVRPAAFLVNKITPSVHASAVVFSLHAPGGGLNILNGCEGLEVLFLLMAAFAIAPLAWRSKVLGMLVGVVVVFVINQARILALFYAYRLDHSLFDPLHGLVAPIAVIAFVAAYFYSWVSIDSGSNHGHAKTD